MKRGESRLPLSPANSTALRPVILRALSVGGCSIYELWLRTLASARVLPAVYFLGGQIGTLFQANSFEPNACLFYSDACDSGALLIGASSYCMHPLGAS